MKHRRPAFLKSLGHSGKKKSFTKSDGQLPREPLPNRSAPHRASFFTNSRPILVLRQVRNSIHGRGRGSHSVACKPGTGYAASMWRCISSLSPVLRGEGWGEGRFVELRPSREWPLTPTLSPEYGGEGAGGDSPQSEVTPPGNCSHPRHWKCLRHNALPLQYVRKDYIHVHKLRAG